MPDTVFLSLCVLCTCGYLLSVTYRRVPVERSGPRVWLRVILLAATTALLLRYPVTLPTGMAVNLGSAPVVFAVMRHGPLAGAVVALPALFAALTGGPHGAAALLHSASGPALTLLCGGAVRAGLRRLAPARRKAARLPGALLTLTAGTLPGALLPGGTGLGASAVVSVLLGAAGYVILSAMIVNRIGQLSATSRWQSQALLDTLTGLANRRQFDHDLANLQDGDAVLAVDIDHFKRVNDTHGHAVGDRVLCAVGHALQGGLRHHDRAYRLGGEEFAVLLRQVTREQAHTVAERLRRAVEARAMAGHPVTISVGVSPVVPGDAPAAVRQADVALYRAKQRGRNRTCAWQSGDLTALDVTKTIIGLA